MSLVSCGIAGLSGLMRLNPFSLSVKDFQSCQEFGSLHWRQWPRRGGDEGGYGVGLLTYGN